MFLFYVFLGSESSMRNEQMISEPDDGFTSLALTLENQNQTELNVSEHWMLDDALVLIDWILSAIWFIIIWFHE